MVIQNARIQYGMNPVEYHAIGKDIPRGDKRFVMSQSQLKLFSECPRRWINGYREDQSSDMEWGSLIDCLALTPHLFDERFAITPETYPPDDKPWNWNAKHCRQWREDRHSEGRECVTFKAHEAARVAVCALKSDPRIADYLSECQAQAAVFGEYVDESTGVIVPMKCLIDIVPSKQSEFSASLADLKTTNNASPRKWQRHVADYGLHVQAALYLAMFNAATGEDREEWRWLVQESFPPYEPDAKLMTSEFYEMGRIAMTQAMGLYCRCLELNWWPTYSDLKLPGYDSIDGWSLVHPEAWMQLDLA